MSHVLAQTVDLILSVFMDSPSAYLKYVKHVTFGAKICDLLFDVYKVI
jgi:hypothetical protein